jgi:pimeloyl-ACP methyl ester carboxylesterase
MMAPNREILPVHHAMAKDMMFIFKTHRFQGSPKPLSDEELQKITVPTQIVLGDQDVFVNIPKSLTRAQRLMANVTTTVIPDCGHMLTIDHPGLAEERLMMLIGGI